MHVCKDVKNNFAKQHFQARPTIDESSNLKESFASCKNLKKANLKSGLYTLKANDEKLPKIAYCDMKNNQETLVGFINLRENPTHSKITFSAYSAPSPSKTFKSAQTITFGGFLIDNGNHFNLSTGQFITPVKGIFEFSFSGTATTTNDSVTYVLLLKNDIIMVQNMGGGGGTHTNLAFTQILSLDVGDVISLRTTGAGITTGTAAFCTFSGKLLELA